MVSASPNNTSALHYENFCRSAFKHGINAIVKDETKNLLNGEIIEIESDPAQLSESHIWKSENLSLIKVTVSYAMQIYISEIEECIDRYCSYNDNCDIEYKLIIKKFNDFIFKVMTANQLDSISRVIQGFQDEIVYKFYSFDNYNGLGNLKEETIKTYFFNNR